MFMLLGRSWRVCEQLRRLKTASVNPSRYQVMCLCMKCETVQEDEFVITSTHTHLKSCESHICLLFGAVFLHFITPSLFLKVHHKKKTRLFALLEGEVEQNRLSLALISFLLPKKGWICSQAVSRVFLGHISRYMLPVLRHDGSLV